MDDPADQKTHAVNCGSNFPLLSDTGGKLADELGIKNERGMSKRTTYVVDAQGVIRSVFNDVKVDGHTNEVLAAVRSL